MDEEQTAEENQTAEPVKRSFVVNRDNPPVYEQRSKNGKLGKILLLIIVVLILLVAGWYFMRNRNVAQPAPVATPVPTETPLPINEPVFNRSDWSLEILNGSGVAGAAKKLADKIQAQGYPIVKTGNAEKDNYSQTQILVKISLQDQVELIIADLKDTIKIASVAGELKEGTASARIIIGKDSI